MRILCSLLALGFASAPLVAFAQEELMEGNKKAPGKKEESKPAPTPTPEAQTQGRFQIRRGFFAEGDLGVYMTFGGRNTNDPMLPSRAASNIEPHLGVTIGYDVASGDSFNVAVGLKFSMGLNGGLGRVSGSELAGDSAMLTTKSADFSVYEAGVQVAISYLLNDRFALTARFDGGAGFLDPDPAKTADNSGAGGMAFAPVFGVGLGGDWYTLLNDFTVGLLVRFQGILTPAGPNPGSGGLIPALAITIPVKYTF
jgi:hypothetical protein